MSRRSPSPSSMVTAATFSCKRCSFVVPGMGTIHGFWARSQAVLLFVKGGTLPRDAEGYVLMRVQETCMGRLENLSDVGPFTRLVDAGGARFAGMHSSTSSGRDAFVAS